MLASNMFFLRSGSGFGLTPGWGAILPVTIVYRKYNVSGNRRQRVYSITGDSGYTLLTRLRRIDSVVWNDPAITACSFQDGVITFVSSAAFTAAEVTVIGN